MAISPIQVSPLTRRIVALYESADESTVWEGAVWYSAARDDCAILAREFNLTLDQACGIVAALSPNLRWERNIRAARNVLQGGTSEAYPANEYKARRIQNGELPLDVLGGLKVRAFYANIASAGLDNSVTVDGHAFNAAYNLIQPVKAARITPRQNSAIQRAYRAAARLKGTTPPAMQAIVWIVWREIALGGTRYADRPQEISHA
jgi:hypothetical protein